MTLPPHLLTVSRPLWLRLAHAVADVGQSAVEGWRLMLARREASRQRAQERAALAGLSAHLLRDVGADPEVIDSARQRDVQRALRLDLHRL